MKEKKRKTPLFQKLITFALAAVLMLTCLPVYAAVQTETESVLSASASKAKVYKTAYKKLLSKSEITVSAKNGPYKNLYSTLKVKPKSFMLLDIDRNGTPELIISDQSPTSSFSTRYIFTIKKGKAVCCGYYSQRGDSALQYSKKHKALYYWWWTNRVGGDGSQLLRISNYKLTGYHGIWTGLNSSVPPAHRIYQYGKGNAEMKNVSKATFDSIKKKYFSDKKTLYKFAANTDANRNRLLK